MRIAINGFGRIGKTFLRTLLTDKQALQTIEVALINIGKGDPEASAIAFKYDTMMGTLDHTVGIKDNKLVIDDITIPLIAELDPQKLPWKEYNIDWVVDATGHYTKREQAQLHLAQGARNVLITAPAHGDDVTIIPGVNDAMYNPQKDHIVSLGSCTTNALATMLKVLHDSFYITQAAMTTIHAYTNTQALLDVDASMKDLRRGRAAALNIIPTSTGAMEVIDRVIPDIAGKISGGSLRVPVAKVSLIDLTVLVKNKASVDLVNKAFKDASQGYMKGYVAFTMDPLVSSDYAGNSNSSIIDGLMTEIHGSLVKSFGWYDNEWGYSERLKDFLLRIAR